MAWGVCAALVAMGAAGCSFSAGSAGSDPDGGADSDAIAGDVTCPDDPDLVACYPFNQNTADATGGNDATRLSGQISFAPGPDGRALVIQSESRIEIANSGDFAADALTIELWLGPEFKDGFIFDLDKRFSVRIYKPNIVRCLIETGPRNRDSASAAVGLARWTHIGCVWDPAEGLQIVVDRTAGELFATTDSPGPANGTPAHIGSDSPGGGRSFLGAIDNLRVWGRALEADQLCVECDAIGDPNM